MLELRVTLTDDQLDALAELVAERLATVQPTREEVQLVDAATVATALGVSRDTIYSYADELGGRRVGDGERPRWRFNLADALAAWQPATEEAPTRATPRRRRSPNGHSSLLPVVER